MSGDCTLQSILEDGEPKEEDESCVTAVEDQTFCINLVAFLISWTCWINLLVYYYSKLVGFILFLCLAGDFSYDLLLLIYD